MRTAFGRADGLTQFGATSQSFLASLAPLLAFPLVGAGLLLGRGAGLIAIADLFATVCALLAPPVLSFELARLWKRDAQWLHFATSFNWCQWALPVVGSILITLLSLLTQHGLSEQSAKLSLVIGLGGYGLWLHWFIARHSLLLSRGRAALLVLGVNLGTVLLVLGPRLVVWKMA